MSFEINHVLDLLSIFPFPHTLLGNNYKADFYQISVQNIQEIVLNGRFVMVLRKTSEVFLVALSNLSSKSIFRRFPVTTS
jgi:hypothetical protein